MKINTLEQPQNYTRLKSIVPVKEKLCLATNDGQIIIKKQQITYLKADSNYCLIHYNGKKILSSQTLSLIASRLHLKNFVRVHRSFVINFDHVEFINGNYSSLTMEDGLEIPISRANKEAVKMQMALHFD